MCLVRGQATCQTHPITDRDLITFVFSLHLHMNHSMILQMTHIKVRSHLHSNKYRLPSRWFDEYQYTYSRFITFSSALNYTFGRFSKKQLFHSRSLDMRWLSPIRLHASCCPYLWSHIQCAVAESSVIISDHSQKKVISNPLLT